MKRMLPNKIRHFLSDVREILYHRAYFGKRLENDIVNQFHDLYYNSHLWKKGYRDTFWLGYPVLKCPLDLWIYQEILFALEPDVIIECGTAYGGSALYLASMCDHIGNGNIFTIDLEQSLIDPKKQLPAHDRIHYLKGSSTSDNIKNQLSDLISPSDKVMVILDSDHSKDHVLKEMLIYSEFVTEGQYMIVEDTNVNGHPVLPFHGPGPMEAVNEFLSYNSDFSIDSSKDKFFLSFNPRGYLIKSK